MLETGSPAPDVLLEDARGRSLRLPALGDGGAALVYFMRSTSCPVCNRHVQDLVRSREEFAASGVTVFLAVPEDRAAATAWKSKRGIPFPVLVGSAGAPHDAVGLGTRVFGAMRQSGSVLIDGLGIVRHAHGSTLPTSGYDRKGILAAVRELRARV
ncbi:peroxiredoxin [Actinomadura logoneensis]|uniref:Peroxiredoxin n=1 Tax=Actinomadura logoneensis TaxID=2293572 RepID=A0A372JA38_9ACTN|nr:redoxin domain-containing protein [Actinomadura logoneensis]RFU36850.1 peroxiredoxin [Actinomadura logoneensis]